MATLPLIPFAKLPRIDYNKKFEKKKRLIWTDDNDFVTPNPIEIEDSSESSSSGSSSEYDLLDHVATLMPGYNEEGKLTKKAHDAHLEDMRPKKVRKDYFKFVRTSLQYVSTMRARERERRKHYIIREYEEKIRKFDEVRRKTIQDELDAQEKELKLEAYRREQRIIRNSRKKKEKSTLAEGFAKDLDKRERAKVQMEFFCEHFPVWRMEGMKRDEIDAEQKLGKQELKKQAELASLERKRRELVVLKKQAELKEDAQLSSQINTMMIKYGMISLAEDTQSYSTDVDQLFAKHRKLRKKKEKEMEKELERSQSWHEEEDNESIDSHTDSFLDSEASTVKVMDLSLHPSTSREALIGVRNILRKTRFKKDKRLNTQIWTIDDFQDTADIHVLHCKKVEEVGALSLAVELSKGAFSSLEVLDLHHSHVRDLGVCRIMQAMKMSQLLTLRVLNLNGNLLTSKCIDYMREVGSQSPVLQVLEELHLSRNELGDDGVEAMIRIVFLELLPCIRVIVMSYNSITDKGFRVMINALAAIHEVYLPHIECFNVNNNLITPALRRELVPLPHFVSV